MTRDETPRMTPDKKKPKRIKTLLSISSVLILRHPRGFDPASSAFRFVLAFSLLTLLSLSASAQDAVIELLLPPGATATADGKDLGDRTHTVNDLKPNETRRIKVAVKFADGIADERLVDVVAGQRIPVPVYHPGPDRPVTLAAHPLTPVNAAAVRRDGRYIAVGLEDRSVVLWDTIAGRPVRTLAGHQKVVLSVAFSPDGKQLLSGSADTTAILWDVETGARLRTYTGHTGNVVSIAFSPDGTRFLTGSPDGTTILRETQTGETIHTLKSKEVLGVAYSPDGATLATASADRTATLWDAKTGAQKVVLKGHAEGVTSVAFSPDGGRVLTGSFENFGLIWDAATGKRLTTTSRHGNDVYSVAFTPDGRRTLTGEREELVMLSDATTGLLARTFVGHTADIVAVIPSADGRTFLSGSRDGTVRLWDLATGRELLTLTTDGSRKTWAVVGPDGLFDGSESGRRALSFRFTKVGAEVDQFFAECYRPGLLAEVWRGERPFAAKPLGRSKPPLVKIVQPKSRVSTTQDATVAVDVTDQGGGVSGLAVEINGARVAAKGKSEPAPDGKATRSSFTVALAPGTNKIRVRAASGDGSWESAPTEIELIYPRSPDHRSRLYVVAVGVGRHAADAPALADLLRRRSAKLYDRVDVVPLLDKDATKTILEDTIRDVAELTRPQDTLVVILCGPGALRGERLDFTPHAGGRVAVDELATAMGTAPALKRVLIVDVAAPDGAAKFALQGAVERLARSQGIYTLAATATEAQRAELGRGLLASALVAADGVSDVTDWFPSAVERAGPLMQKLPGPRPDVRSSSQARGFPILSLDR